jgi:hypothetical protein
MAVLTDMVTQISTDMGRLSAANLLVIRTYIATAIRFYQNNRFWFNESESVLFNTVIGTTDYAFDGATISTEFFKIDGVFIATASVAPVELDFYRPGYMNALILANAGQTTQPTNWSYYNKTLRLFPAPDKVYSIELMGHVNLAAPSSDSDATNGWLNNAYDLIMCHTKAELYAHRWEDPVQAAVMSKAESIWLTSMQGETADKFRSGYVSASDF